MVKGNSSNQDFVLGGICVETAERTLSLVRPSAAKLQSLCDRITMLILQGRKYKFDFNKCKDLKMGALRTFIKNKEKN